MYQIHTVNCNWCLLLCWLCLFVIKVPISACIYWLVPPGCTLVPRLKIEITNRANYDRRLIAFSYLHGVGLGRFKLGSRFFQYSPNWTVLGQYLCYLSRLFHSIQTHYYQPLWTLIGAGIRQVKDSERPMSKVIPRSVNFISDRVVRFEPDASLVHLSSGRQVSIFSRNFPVFIKAVSGIHIGRRHQSDLIFSYFVSLLPS